jgi:hypothetical protein
MRPSALPSVLRPLILIGLLLLAACRSAEPPPMPTYPPLSFAGPKITFLAARMEASEDYTPPLAAPHVEHLVPLSPADAARQWAEGRLAVTGTGLGQVRLAITEASIVAEALPPSSGLGKAVSEGSRRFTGTLRVRLSYEDADNAIQRVTEAVATRVRVMPANVTLNERDRALYELSAALARDIDAAMVQQIAAYMGDVTTTDAL